MVDTLNFRTKGELVYERVRKRILAGDYAPGERISMSAIARELGVSDIPVREGIKRLQAEGLLEYETHKGAVISGRLSPTEIKELFAIRAELEALALRQAAESLTAAQLMGLRRILDQMLAAADERDATTYGQLNREFHLAIYGAQPYRKLSAMIQNLWDSTDWCRRIFSADERYLPSSTAEHEEIFTALQNRDADTAERVLRAQKERALGWLLDHVEGLEVTDGSGSRPGSSDQKVGGLAEPAA